MSTPLHFGKFNEKVKAMNSGNARELRMSAAEARALHADLFAVLDELHTLRANGPEEDVIEVVLDAGDNSL